MKINFMFVMGVTSEAMEANEDYRKSCDIPWKNVAEYEKKCKIVERKSRANDKQNEALWAVHVVTGIPWDALYNAVRIERKYEKKHNYEKCLFLGDSVWEEEKREKLFKSLMAKSPEELIGIYRNEFCEGAIRRLENKRYDECHLYRY